ncbi:unnamed protein product [Brassicogethes aeneus]|uniref:DUF4817 domain-containing protein n=1 Tax=Brassicogethes aeneus TaxID=1431903 RepID=A0A9P0B488_BRAAE|nr:unnamed protein product [Brassicogethes aeneus]
MKYTNEEKVDMLFVYARAFRNAKNAAETYANLYPEKQVPDTKIFARLEKNLRELGMFEKPKKRKPTVTEEGGEEETNVLGDGGDEEIEVETLRVSFKGLHHLRPTPQNITPLSEECNAMPTEYNAPVATVYALF